MGQTKQLAYDHIQDKTSTTELHLSCISVLLCDTLVQNSDTFIPRLREKMTQRNNSTKFATDLGDKSSTPSCAGLENDSFSTKCN